MNTVFLIDILIIKQQNVTMFAHCVLSQHLKKEKGEKGRKSDSVYVCERKRRKSVSHAYPRIYL